MPISPWATVGVYFIVATVIALIISAVPGIFTSKRPTKTKLEAYECGVPPTSAMIGRFPVRFYLVAMLFVVFVGMSSTVFAVVQGEPSDKATASGYKDTFFTVAPIIVFLSLVVLLGVYVPPPLSRALHAAAAFIEMNP